MRTVLPPPGVNPITVNKYIIHYITSRARDFSRFHNVENGPGAHYAYH